MFASIYAKQSPAKKLRVSNRYEPKIVLPQKKEHAVYLKGLNGLRAIAVFAVIATHILQVFSYDIQSGSFGVTIFFTLSGFLITYLLLLEKKRTGGISILNFYKRRILRIWPLYYLYLAVALLATYFIFVKKITFLQVFFHTLFLANVSYATNTLIPNVEHYWSLAVEEQFYLFWPLVTIFFSKKFIPFCLLFISAMLLIRVGINQLYGTANPVYYFFYYLRFDNMAVGGLAAYLYYKKAAVLNLFHHLVFQVAAWGVLLLVLMDQYHTFRVLDHEIVSVCTVILIINQVSNPKTLISLENDLFNYVGGISYGLYIIHPLVISSLMLAYKYYHITTRSTLFINLNVETFIITICLAHVSYKYYESWFLKLKQRFTIVKNSGAAAVTPL